MAGPAPSRHRGDNGTGRKGIAGQIVTTDRWLSYSGNWVVEATNGIIGPGAAGRPAGAQCGDAGPAGKKKKPTPSMR